MQLLHILAMVTLLYFYVVMYSKSMWITLFSSNSFGHQKMRKYNGTTRPGHTMIWFVLWQVRKDASLPLVYSKITLEYGLGPPYFAFFVSGSFLRISSHYQSAVTCCVGKLNSVPCKFFYKKFLVRNSALRLPKNWEAPITGKCNFRNYLFDKGNPSITCRYLSTV